MLASHTRAARGLFGRATGLAVLACLLAACGDKHGVRRIELTECRVPKLVHAAQCGKVDVLEDRSKPEGRKLSIAVTLLPANTLNPQPDPLFMLAGGPGQSSDAIAPLAEQLSGVRRTRDIVLIDPRGSGRSAPLSCAALKPRDPFDELLDADTIAQAAHHCIAELLARGDVDVAQYSTSAYVADIDEVRGALGYERVNLWGGSYGTRAAQEYVRRYPARVRSVVLDGVAPPEMKLSLDVWASRDAAIARVIAHCAEDPQCRQAYPDLNATLARIRAKLESPRRFAVNDPRTGAPHNVPLSFDAIVGALHGLVYAPELASLIPPLLASAEAGDFSPLAAAAMMLTADFNRTMNLALHYAVTCAEDASRTAPSDVQKIIPNLRAPVLAERNLEACLGWPRASVPADFFSPLTSDKPVLILSGGLDPVTPPANGEKVAQTLPNSRHVVAAGYGHIVSPHACAPRLIAKFIDEAGFATLPQSCLDYLATSKPPPLFASLLGPR